MQYKVLGFSLISLLALTSFHSKSLWAMGKAPGDARLLSNAFRIEKVKLSNESRTAGNWGKVFSCDAGFKGTHAGNTVTIYLDAEGGDGHYSHTLLYVLGDTSYQLENKEGGEKTVSRHGNGTVSIQLPPLKNNIPFVDQAFFLTSTDESGRSVSVSRVFRISRPYILSVSTDPESTRENCYQRYEPEISNMGVQTNGSTALSHLEIRQGIEKTYSDMKGWQFGVYFNPMIGYQGFLASLFTVNASYFSETSKQTTEKVEISQSYDLNPNDVVEVYYQPTRYITAYDVTRVNPCGMEEEKFKGAYLFQTWSFSYHVAPANLGEPGRHLLGAIGAPVENTCSPDLTDEVQSFKGKMKLTQGVSDQSVLKKYHFLDAGPISTSATGKMR